MLRPAVCILAGLTAVLAAAAPARAQSFDPRRCSAIRDVAVPYEITRDGRSIVFTGAGQRITVSDRAIVVGSARLDDPALAEPYAASLRHFMTSSSRFSVTAAGFGQTAARDRDAARARTPGFLGAMRDLCQSLLEVSAAQTRIKSAFPAFVAPIRVTLAN